jgi:hypothetical protein
MTPANRSSTNSAAADRTGARRAKGGNSTKAGVSVCIASERPRINPGATERPRGIWQMPRRPLVKEHEKAIFDVPQAPSGILAHAPGDIDKMRELIVGLQTDLPKRAIIPFGGWRVVVASLQANGYKAGPAFELPNGRMVATLHREGRVRRHRVLHPCVSG